MNIPIVSIIVAVILVALLWWVCDQMIKDEMIRKVIRVVIVVLCVLYVVSLLTGGGPVLTFR